MKSRVEHGEVNEAFAVTKIYWENEKKVTLEQMDWIFSNFEKIYNLWHPGCHIDFSWIKPETEHPVNSVHWASELYGPKGEEQFMAVAIRWLPLEEVPPFVTQYIEHTHGGVFAAIPCAKPEDYQQPPAYPIYVVHTYSATPDGSTEGIDFCVYLKETQFGYAWAPHGTEEASTVENFVPQLYELYSVVDNPVVNRKYNLEFATDGGKLSYRHL